MEKEHAKYALEIGVVEVSVVDVRVNAGEEFEGFRDAGLN